MRIFYLLVLLLTFQNSFSQKKSTEIILGFNYTKSFENLEIKIIKTLDSTKVTIYSKKIIEYYYSMEKENKVFEIINRNFYINNTIFDNLLMEINAISKSDLNKNTIVIDNGKITSLKVKDNKINLHYEVLALKIDNCEGELKKFLDVCIEILEICELNPENYFK